MYIISRCLLGDNCKYNGGNNLCEDVIEFIKEHSYIAVCSESAGGLESPRDPAEIVEYGGQELRVIDRKGVDRTEAFVRGAEISYANAQAEAERRGECIEGAILQARSPSCGAGKIYDGTFSGNLIEGDGLFVRILREHGIPVMNDNDFIEGRRIR